MKLVWKRFIQIVSYWIMAFLACNFIFMWFVAFFNGNHVLMTINDYGEANPELVMWILILPVIFYGVFMSAKDMRQLMREAKKYKVKVGSNDIPA